MFAYNNLIRVLQANWPACASAVAVDGSARILGQGAAAQRKHELDYVAYTRPGKWHRYRSPAPFLSRAQEKIERCA